MKKLFFGIIILTLSFSCAKQETEDLTEYADKTFDLWMAKNHPEATRLESGAYVQWLEKNSSGKQLSNENWMKLNYTYSRLNGNIYASRSEQIAKQLGNFLYTTHYTSDYLPFYPADLASELYPASYGLALGQVDVLKLMSEGDSVRIYLPYKSAYTYGGYVPVSGFSAPLPSSTYYSVSAGENVTIDMRLAEIVTDPKAYENAQFERYALDSMGITNLADSIHQGIYKKIISPNPSGNVITADSTVSVYFIGRFMDGQVFDTNIDTIAVNNNIYSSSSSYTAKSLNPSSSSTYVEGFWRSIQSMRKGERSTFIFLSTLGYGITAYGNNIQPYTPLIFEIYVEN